MKKTLIIIGLIVSINNYLIAQKYESVTVKAGKSIKDYFTPAERYLYPNFTEGKGYFKNGRVIPCRFNFNLLTGEIEFIQTNDTLLISKKEEINSIVVAQDTFYYHDAYLQMIRSGLLSVYIKRSIVIQNVLKQGAMGTINRSAASDSYNFVITGQRSVDLKQTEDLVLQRKDEYYYSTSGSDFFLFNKKNIIKIMQGREERIKNYLKSNKVDFEAKEDILRLADFVSNLLSENYKKR